MFDNFRNFDVFRFNSIVGLGTFVMSDKKYAYMTICKKKKRVHRHVMEAHLGRELSQNEHVYFRDGDTSNLDIDNLVIITKNSRKVKTLKST